MIQKVDTVKIYKSYYCYFSFKKFYKLASVLQVFKIIILAAILNPDLKFLWKIEFNNK